MVVLAVDDVELEVAHEILDVGIVVAVGVERVVLVVLRNAVPGLQLKDETPALPDDAAVEAVPAARERLAAAIRLVRQAEREQRRVAAEDLPRHRRDPEQLGLVIGFAKRRRDIGVVGLPERLDGETDEQCVLLGEQGFGDRRLQAQLELDLEVVEVFAEIAAAGLEDLVVRAGRVGQRQHVVAPVGEQHRGVILHLALALEPVDDERIRRLGGFCRRVLVGGERRRAEEGDQGRGRGDWQWSVGHSRLLMIRIQAASYRRWRRRSRPIRSECRELAQT